MRFERITMLSEQFRNKLLRLNYTLQSLEASRSESSIRDLKYQKERLVREIQTDLEQIKQELHKYA